MGRACSLKELNAAIALLIIPYQLSWKTKEWEAPLWNPRVALLPCTWVSLARHVVTGAGPVWGPAGSFKATLLNKGWDWLLWQGGFSWESTYTQASHINHLKRSAGAVEGSRWSKILPHVLKINSASPKASKHQRII